MEAAITVPFSVCPLAVTRAGNSSLYSISTVPVQTIGLRSSTETADCLDDFETTDNSARGQFGPWTTRFMVVPAPLPLRPQSMRPQTHAAPIPIRPQTYPAPGRSGPILLNIEFAPRSPFTSHVPSGPAIVVPVGRSGPTFFLKNYS